MKTALLILTTVIAMVSTTIAAVALTQPPPTPVTTVEKQIERVEIPAKPDPLSEFVERCASLGGTATVSGAKKERTVACEASQRTAWLPSLCATYEGDFSAGGYTYNYGSMVPDTDHCFVNSPGAEAIEHSDY